VEQVHQPSHYARFAIEPITFSVKNELSLNAGNAIKYICRHDAKNGAQDLKKALRSIQMELEHRYDLHVPIDWDGEYEVDGLDGPPKQGDILVQRGRSHSFDVLTNPDANPAFRPDVGAQTNTACACGRYADHECGGPGSSVKRRDCPFEGPSATVQAMQGSH